jgi:hypothetical protein
MKKRVIIGCIIVIIMLEIPIATADKIQITSEELKRIRDSIEEVKDQDEELNEKLIQILTESLTIDENENIWLDLNTFEQGLNEIPTEENFSTETSASFVFAYISGSVYSHTKQDGIIHIQGSLTISGLGTVYTYHGETFGFYTIPSSHAKTNIFIGILNDNRVNGIGLPVIIDYNEKDNSKHTLFGVNFFQKLIERFQIIDNLFFSSFLINIFNNFSHFFLPRFRSIFAISAGVLLNK